jgi:hypothetical protein
VILTHSTPHIKLEGHELHFFLGEHASITRGQCTVSFTSTTKRPGLMTKSSICQTATSQPPT